jgi:hypothetical protein
MPQQQQVIWHHDTVMSQDIPTLDVSRYKYALPHPPPITAAGALPATASACSASTSLRCGCSNGHCSWHRTWRMPLRCLAMSTWLERTWQQQRQRTNMRCAATRATTMHCELALAGRIRLTTWWNWMRQAHYSMYWQHTALSSPVQGEILGSTHRQTQSAVIALLLLCLNFLL